MDEKQLRALLEKYEQEYYNNKEAIIEDVEYNTLLDRYYELTGKEYDFIPGEITSDNKVEHTHPIMSLDKVKITDEERLRAEIKRLGEGTGVIIEPKFDGLTIVKYPDGKCVSRGDGHFGENLTASCKDIRGLQFESIYPVRTEVLMPKSSFEVINRQREAEGLEAFKNPRNAAAGMLRNLDSSKVKGLEAYAYDLIGYTLQHSVALYAMANDNHMLVTPHWRFKDVDKAIEFIKSFDRESLDYEIDGLVIKSDHKNSLEKFGMTGHHPKNAIAVKFVAEEKWSQLNHIVWQVGRTGKKK